MRLNVAISRIEELIKVTDLSMKSSVALKCESDEKPFFMEGLNVGDYLEKFKSLVEMDKMSNFYDMTDDDGNKLESIDVGIVKENSLGMLMTFKGKSKKKKKAI
ncbi:MAG: hypothetical protein MJZ34_05035 [Paludibacteraceae bacterium]|nr:hypothetical protein [Paludibacteraceae bacterium]